MREKQDWVPTKMMRWFTVMTVGWWFIAGGIHAISVFAGGRNKLWYSIVGSEHGNLTVVEIQWPAPRKLFKVSSLHCNASHTWISNKFAAFAVERTQSEN